MAGNVSDKRLIKNPSTPVNWFLRIGALIAFINMRRRDERWPVWPVKQLLALVAVMVAIVLLVMFVVDPPFLALLRQHNLSSNPVFQLVTFVGKSNWILITTGSLVVLMSLLSPDRVRGRLYAVWNRVFLTSWFVFYSVAVSGLATLGAKFLVGRIRPSYNIGESAFEFSHFSHNYAFNSFPSGHSTTAGAMAMAMALLLPNLRWPIVAGWLVVASSRFIIGAHFPSDVIAGVAVGMAITWIYARSMARRRMLFEFDKNGGLQLRRPEFAPLRLTLKMFKQTLIGDANFKAGSKSQKG